MPWSMRTWSMTMRWSMDVVVEDVVSSEVVQAWLGVDVVEAPSMVESELVGPADAVVGAVVAVEPEATSVPGSAEGVPQAPATSRNSGRASVHRPVGRDPMRRRSLTSISSRLGERETRDLGPSTPRIQGRR